MRAMVVDDVRAQPEVRDVPAPEAPPGGVVVRVLATGLCHSDWHAWAGHDDIAFPHVPGCGRCSWCAAGDAQVCPDQEQPGFTHWGSFAEQVALHAADTNLVAVPDGVDMATAASLGCRFATAYRALVARARVQPQEWVTVIGAGGVGLSSVMIAKALGARVVAVDRNPGALEAASAVGAEHVVLADGRDVPATIAELTGGGSHLSVDAVGSEQTASDAVLGLRRRGRHVQVGLLPSISGHPRVPMERAIAWELDLLGSHGMAAVDYPGMLALVADGSLRPQDLVERTIGLEEAADLLPRFDTATLAGMTIIDPSR